MIAPHTAVNRGGPRLRRAARWLGWVAAGMLLVGCALLLLPNATHQDMPHVGDDIFFDCGGAVYPGARPAEEPGITACREINDAMLRWGLSFLAGGAALALASVVMRSSARRRT